jgi:23S rRNA (guanine745-N1)-methyltransferase
MIDVALPYLRCPVCEDTLTRADPRTLRCPRGHSLNIAKQGYASLATGRTPHSGDTTEMITAREAFLAAGHYAFIADAVTAAARQAVGTPPDAPQTGPAPGPDVSAGLVVDAGTGTGYYLARALDALPHLAGLGLDVSKPALRRAARAHDRAAAALADLWRPLPLASASVSVILNVFAPRNGAEYRRILRPGGALLVVTPAAGHLRELIDAGGLIRVDPQKSERLAATLGAHFTAGPAATHARRLRLSGEEIRTLVGMTPSARHVTLSRLPKEDIDVTAAVDVTVFHPAP